MWSIISNGGNTAYGVQELMCESVADLQKLPETIVPGSTVLILKPQLKVYIKDISGEWVEV